MEVIISADLNFINAQPLIYWNLKKLLGKEKVSKITVVTSSEIISKFIEFVQTPVNVTISNSSEAETILSVANTTSDTSILYLSNTVLLTTDDILSKTVDCSINSNSYLFTNIALLKTLDFYSVEEIVEEYSKTHTFSELIDLNISEKESCLNYILKNYCSLDKTYKEYNFEEQTVTTRVIPDEPYSSIERDVEHFLYSTSSALSAMEGSQKAFVPSVVDTSVTLGGNFINEITTSSYEDTSLLSGYLYDEISREKLIENLEKIVHVTNEIFFKDSELTTEDYIRGHVEEGTVLRSIDQYTEAVYSIVDYVSTELELEDTKTNSLKKICSGYYNSVYNHCNSKTFFQQGNAGRFTPGCLLDSDIKISKNNTITFVGTILDVNEYVYRPETLYTLLFSYFTGYDMLYYGLYKEGFIFQKDLSFVTEHFKKYLENYGEFVLYCKMVLILAARLLCLSGNKEKAQVMIDRIDTL